MPADFFFSSGRRLSYTFTFQNNLESSLLKIRPGPADHRVSKKPVHTARVDTSAGKPSPGRGNRKASSGTGLGCCGRAHSRAEAEEKEGKVASVTVRAGGGRRAGPGSHPGHLCTALNASSAALPFRSEREPPSRRKGRVSPRRGSAVPTTAGPWGRRGTEPTREAAPSAAWARPAPSAHAPDVTDPGFKHFFANHSPIRG